MSVLYIHTTFFNDRVAGARKPQHRKGQHPPLLISEDNAVARQKKKDASGRLLNNYKAKQSVHHVQLCIANEMSTSDWETTRTVKTTPEQVAIRHHHNLLIAVLVIQILLFVAVGTCIGLIVYVMMTVDDTNNRQILVVNGIAKVIEWLKPH
jgi:hypothetical protein